MISERERELLKRLLSEVDEFPSPFRDWLVKYLELNLTTAIASGSIKDSQLVPATGVLADMPPGRLLTYNEVTSATTISATNETTADPIVTASAFTFDGTTPVWIEGSFPDVSSISAWTLTFVLRDDTAGASIGILGNITLGASATFGPINMRRKLTPVSGSRTYSIRAFRTTANGAVNAGAGGAGNKMPGFIRITKG